MTIISDNIESAVRILENNDVVAIPTETVYGLAGNIFSEKAIRKIFEVKKRPLFNPLIVHIDTTDKLDEIVSEIPVKAQKLAKAFWPGSLTLILKKKSNIPDLITAGKDTVAVRIPNHPLTLELLSKLPFPLAAPSANPFGSISPTSAEHVNEYFNDSIKQVLDGGSCHNGIESTIVGFEDGEPVIYRFGSISAEEIIEVIGEVKVHTKEEHAPQAPGMLERHYAPNTKTYLVSDVQEFIIAHKSKRIGVITFSKVVKHSSIKQLELLSSTGDLKEAAQNLYQTLHKLDKLDLDIIVAEQMPNKGLGISINDRLTRATK